MYRYDEYFHDGRDVNDAIQFNFHYIYNLLFRPNGQKEALGTIQPPLLRLLRHRCLYFVCHYWSYHCSVNLRIQTSFYHRALQQFFSNFSIFPSFFLQLHRHPLPASASVKPKYLNSTTCFISSPGHPCLVLRYLPLLLTSLYPPSVLPFRAIVLLKMHSLLGVCDAHLLPALISAVGASVTTTNKEGTKSWALM